MPRVPEHRYNLANVKGMNHKIRYDITLLTIINSRDGMKLVDKHVAHTKRAYVTCKYMLIRICMKNRLTGANWPVGVESALLVGRIAHTMRNVVLNDTLSVGVANFRKTFVHTRHICICAWKVMRLIKF